MSHADDVADTARRLAVVTVTYNSADVLPGLLDSLSAALEGAEPWDVFVVDNDSRDDSVAIARAHPIGARVVETGRNAGYSAGINAGAALAGPHADLLILNPDIRVSPGAVRRLIDRLADPRIGVAVPKMLHEDGSLAKSLRREPSVATAWCEALVGGRLAERIGLGEVVGRSDTYAQDCVAEWATGAALMISAGARRVVGDWDESFFLYSEEVDYLRRVRTVGLDVVYVAEASVVHKGGDYERSAFLSALMTRNRIRYFRRHHGPISNAAFQSAVVVGAAIRAGRGVEARAVLKAALTA